MKKRFYILFAFATMLLAGISSTNTFAQIDDPVLWEFYTEDVNGNEATLVFKCTIDPGWYVYSQHLVIPPGEIGPEATDFVFKKNDSYELIGEASEGKGKTEYDPNFEMDLKKFTGTVFFKQKVKLKDPANFKITGELWYMTCTDKKCLPPDNWEFEFTNHTNESGGANSSQEQTTPVEDKKTEEPKEDGNSFNIAPIDQSTLDEANAADNSTEQDLAEDKATDDASTTPTDTVEEAEGGCGGHESEGNLSFWMIFLTGFAGGFIALLTPCVFPMIPLTVSFFTKQSKTRAAGITNAIWYGVSIILIYVALGFFVTKIFGADALNILSTDPFFNLFFFFLLVFFAISFFGAFEITLPSSWINKADTISDKGGLFGIFFMAFTLSLVSFSCTGPIIGTLLVDAAVKGDVMGPIIGMFGFSLALALPFMLFAAFPGWLNSLPQSGGWLNSVKVVLGFLELAFAFKFLSNADLVIQGHFLQRELFIAIWIAVFGSLALYLFGFIRFPHDSKTETLSVPRAMFGMLALMFTIYLVPGMNGAPLKLISGFPPPSFYSESSDDMGHCPHNLNCFHDYDAALAYAKEVNKPLMLDFTGWACVNCRKMEEQVWSDPKVLSRLRENVVLVSLYVDEDIPLPKEEQEEYKVGKKTKKMKTVGNKWSRMQAERFNTNSQPYYVMLDVNEAQLHESAAYDPDIDKFVKWLDCGVEQFEIGATASVDNLRASN
ncbi:MAG: thiol:disulfide interchange protein [Bacteroidia bacterium]|nr:thiol:disulfide interchange protein [Bacteroidia bacterium]